MDSKKIKSVNKEPAQKKEVINFPDGRQYKGEAKESADGKERIPHGKGIMKYNSNPANNYIEDYYDGQFVEGKKHGKGERKYSDGI